MGQKCIAYVSEMPNFSRAGGVVHVASRSGNRVWQTAYPMWLFRLVHARMGEIIANQDETRLPPS